VPFAVPFSAVAVPLAVTLWGVVRVVVLAECSLVLVMPVVKQSAMG
jgi:hypothetical protein